MFAGIAGAVVGAAVQQKGGGEGIAGAVVGAAVQQKGGGVVDGCGFVSVFAASGLLQRAAVQSGRMRKGTLAPQCNENYHLQTADDQTAGALLTPAPTPDQDREAPPSGPSSRTASIMSVSEDVTGAGSRLYL